MAIEEFLVSFYQHSCTMKILGYSPMLLAYLCVILCFRLVIADPSREFSARELDSLLQDYAFRAFVRPRTGVVYDGNVPANLTGIHVAAQRLRSGSLRRRGVAKYKEFHIPIGVIVEPYVVRLVLVYHNLGNLSSLYYPLPGYAFLAPVLGLLAYDATNLSATNLSELDIRASGDPISITFPNVDSIRGRSSSSPSPKCVFFGLDGSFGFESLVNGSTCLTTYQGHFSIVVEAPPAPAPAPTGVGGGPTSSPPGIGGGNAKSRRTWIISSSVVGGAVFLVLLGVAFVCLKRCRLQKQLTLMEAASESGVALAMVRVGNTMAPVAMETRTRPVLENEFVP